MNDAVVVVIEDDKGRVLFAQRAASDTFPGLWNTITGEVEGGESLHQAARRETLEEVGIEIEVEEKFFESVTNKGHFLLHWLRAKPLSLQLVLDQEEIADACWLRKEEVANLRPQFRETATLFKRYWSHYGRKARQRDSD